MSTPEDLYEQHHRRLCPSCGHSYVWHGSGRTVLEYTDGDPDGCGVAGCKCAEIDPEDH